MISASIMRDSSPITLSEDVANQPSQRPILYQTGFTLLPATTSSDCSRAIP